jgi:hypothetical protein
VTDTPAERARGGNGRFLRSIGSIDRDREAAQLIAQGWTYERAADHLGYPDKSACWRGVQQVRREAALMDGSSEQVRQRQLAELAELRQRIWQQVTDPAPAVDRVGRIVRDGAGNVVYDAQALAAAEALLIRLSEREGRIRGSDAPKRSVSLTGSVGVKEVMAVLEHANAQDIHEAVEEMERRLRARVADESRQARAIQGHAEPDDDGPDENA